MGIDFDKALNAAEQIVGKGKSLAELYDLFDPDEKVIQRPKGTRVPHAHFTDAMWIQIQPKVLLGQTKAARGEQATRSSKEITKPDGSKAILPLFKFLAPVEILENIVHEWQPYESIVTRLLQKGVDAYRIVSDFTTIARPTYEAAESIFTKATGGKQITPGDVKGELTGIVSKMTQATVPRVKLDTPLVYQDSTRRQYTMNFTLVDEGDTFKDVVFPVKTLEYLSSAGYDETKGEFIGYSPPHIFEVTTVPGTKLVNMRNAALTSIQPIYRQPYRSGYPSICELTLTFTEIEPFYKRQVERGQKGTVTVSITPGVSLSLGQTQDLSIAGISGRKWKDKFSKDTTKYVDLASY